MPRDEFSQDVKEILARRVGYRCSNPNCRALTSGPHDNPGKAVNIGVAAHITAAAPGGPRYNPNLSSEERKSPENGIWLCQNHGKLVDNDEETYPISLLNDWKKLSEEAARLEVERPSNLALPTKTDDLSLIRFYSQCFDRPAFQDPFMREGSMEAFDKAIEDTITAINTGTLLSRQGQVLSQSKGKSYLENSEWRRRMDVIVDLLRALRGRYADAIASEEIHIGSEHGGRYSYDIRNANLADWMDSTRIEILKIFAAICAEAGIPSLQFPRHHYRRW